jgi:hypothetical protein
VRSLFATRVPGPKWRCPLVVKQTDANLSKLRWLSPQIAGAVADLVSPPFWNLPAPIHKEFCGKSPHPMIV